ncbi:MAG: YncE family protein [Acidobacteriota bacterium]|nr:YncE family protein [Acidobacteriota bacterium]
MKNERANTIGAVGLFAAALITAIILLIPGAARLRAARRPAVQNGTGYHLVHTYKIGGNGFWDYMLVDPEHRHLFVSHSTHVVVLNVDTGKIVGDIPNTDGVHGIAIAPKLNRGFVSDGEANQVTIFNLASLKTIGTVKVTGKDPDCIIYDPATERVFTFNGDSQNSTAIDAKTGKVLGTISLGGDPEYAVADGRGHVYNNLESTSEQVEIDSRTLKITRRWSLAPCKEPSGLAMDVAHRRLFAGCRNQTMAVTNPDTGKVVATFTIGPMVDACRFDPGTQLAFCSSGGGTGTLTVVREDSPDKYTLLGHVKTEAYARTMALDTKTHNVFLVTAALGPRPPKATPQNPHRHGKMAPGSFRVIELAQ